MARRIRYMLVAAATLAAAILAGTANWPKT
jgi:outer membrane murein-binding lipoprotein Lpp